MPPQASTLADLWPADLANKTAVVTPDDGRSITYAQLRTQTAGLAHELRRRGVRPGDVLSVVMPNGLPYLTTFLAVTWARAVAAPLNPAYKQEEFSFSMEDAGAKALLILPGEQTARAAAAQLGIPVWEVRLGPDGLLTLDTLSAAATASPEGHPQPDDVALFLHTSGTTSRPKGVPLTHQNLTTSLRNIVATYGLTPDDASLIVMPLFHVHGLLGATLSTLLSGGTAVIPSRFSATAFWPLAWAHRVTWYSAVPTIHQVLLSRADADAAPRGTLRFIRSCSSALAPVVFAQMEGRFEAPVLEAYGMTEASHQMASNPLPPGRRRAGTVGRGSGVEIVILDEKGNELPAGTPGEVSIRGRNVMAGYRNNPEATAAAFTRGYFRTGDQGVLDADGYLTLTGRLKELINRGGEKVSPLEVDAALLEHPQVAEAVAFAVPDPKYGEEVHGAVVLRGEATPDEILAFCRQRLADFKVPKRLHVTDALPRTATGKVQRRHVAAHFQQPRG
jgi:acyl-CoA synthetase (AMP-forming)/AMP-acid ligase II